MTFLFTKHANSKFFIDQEIYKLISHELVINTIKKPDYYRQDNKTGAKLALKSLDNRHDLRVVYSQSGGIIKILTFYPVAKGRYS